MRFDKLLESYLQRSGKVMVNSPYTNLLAAVDILMEARSLGNWIFAAGNGGSATTASHFANDFVKGLAIKDKKRFKVHALNDNISILTALSNDYDYSVCFSEQLKNYAQRGDVLMVFTGSGNSENMIKAAEYAKQIDMKVIAFTGKDGGRVKDYCDVVCMAPTEIMEEIEDAHLVWEHAFVYGLRQIIEKE